MKRGIIVGTVILSMVIGVSIYNYDLNQTICVVEEEVEISHLPEAFNEFKILQVSDLHGFYFGKNQEQLIELTHQLDYDLLALTGDLGDLDTDPEGEAMKVFLTGISKDKPIVYVEGNHGPFIKDQRTGEKTETAYWLEEQGVHLLEAPLILEREDSRLVVAYQTEPFARAEGLESVTEEDVLIGVMHYPLDELFYQGSRQSGTFPPYDLILAGHYHGGQWRIPFYGAIFVSDIYGNGWFPSQSRVSGLNHYSGYYQYVSRGLGASGGNPLLKQRWFNPPEVNLLTLKAVD